MKRLDLVGEKFGRWTVLKDVGNKKGCSYWLCRCDCGTERIVLGGSLKSGDSKSCGCLQKEKVSEVGKGKRLNLVGEKIGRLLVLKDVGNNKWGQSQFLCRCVCGNKVIVSGNNLKSDNTKSCGCYNREKASERFVELTKNQKNENHPNYKHGLTETKAYAYQINAKRRALKRNQIAANYDQEKVAYLYKVCAKFNEIGIFRYVMDHWQPISKGGEDGQDNLQILLESLNAEKYNRWPLTEEEKIRYKGITLEDLKQSRMFLFAVKKNG